MNPEGLDWSTAPLDHESLAFVVDDLNDRDWYRCSCGGEFGIRQWPPRTGRRGERVPTIVKTKRQHIEESLAAWLAQCLHSA